MSAPSTSTAGPDADDPGPSDTPVPHEGRTPLAAPATTDAVDPRGPAGPHHPSGTGTPPRRRWPIVLIAGGLLVGGAAAGLALVTSGSDDADDDAADVTIRAVTAEQRDLVEYTDLDGTLGWAEVRRVTTAVPGTITAVVDDGTALERGDVIYEIDAVPVSVFHGDIPLYRSLTVGDEGDDVELLEANLASLGHHLGEPDDADAEDDDSDEVDTGFTVDGVYDEATADAVRRWQAELGIAETGAFELGSVVVTPGPATVSGLQVELGSVVQANTPVADLNVTGDVDAHYSETTGELELEVTSGPVATGQVLYTVDGLPVTAVVSDETFDRDLVDGVADGDDILVIEEMLVALGYDARGDLVPDDEFDELTAEAIEDWEADLQDTWDDVVVDGQLSLDQIVVVEPGTTVGTVTDRDGDIVATGSELFTWQPAGDGGTARIVTTAIDVADQAQLTQGTAVDVEFPDGSLVTGTVVDVATSSTVDPMDPDAEPQLAVEIALASVPESAAGLTELDVSVKLVDNLAAGATVVPASALVATADGGYAVEVVEVVGGADPGSGAETSFVAVDPGMFADGFVEVTGIAPGTAVVVPS